MKLRISILDDELETIKVLKKILLGMGHAVEVHEDSIQCERGLFTTDVLLLDLHLNGENGIDLLAKWKKEYPEMYIVMISGQAGITDAVKAIKMGANNFIEKPLHLNEIKDVLFTAQIEVSRQQDHAHLKKLVRNQLEILGESNAIQQLKKEIKKLATINEPILILGETGVGKEKAADNIHFNSIRKNKEFIKINIATISNQLADSLLFGHKKGAFSGAISDKKGFFEEANGGTLFLDEIGEASLELQVKLLRVLQEGEIQPVGASKPIRIDVRCLFATHHDLGRDVENSLFREDLLYRINGFTVKVPPLRERQEDLQSLSNFFIYKFCEENNYPLKHLSDDALSKLKAYSFPGNIRQLKNMLSRACFNSEDRTELIHTDFSIEEDARQIDIDQEMLEETGKYSLMKKKLEREYLQFQLHKFNQNIEKTAKALDILPNNFRRKLRDLGIQIGIQN